MRRIPALAVAVATLGPGTTAAIAHNGTVLSASLSPSRSYPHAHGSSDYSRDQHSREVEVTVSGLAGLSGRRLTVYVAGKRVGSLKVFEHGRVDQDWSTDHGQRVPFAAPGSSVKVVTAGGTLVASGSYHRHH